MKTISSDLQNHLNNNNQFVVADLYTISLLQTAWDDGTSTLATTYVNLYYTSYDIDITYDGNIYLANKIVIEREMMRLVMGVEVDPLRLKISAPQDYQAFAGKNLMSAVTGGVFDGARVKLFKCFLGADNLAIGVINMFSGRMSESVVSRAVVDLTIKSDLELLNIQMPRMLYQPSCTHTLFNSDCGLNKADYVESGTVSAVATNQITTTLSSASGYYDLGVVVFTSGALANQSKTVKTWDGTKLTFLNLIAQLPAIGDEFVIYPGCNKTIETCRDKFDNLENFKGFPFIPSPEVAFY